MENKGVIFPGNAWAKQAGVLMYWGLARGQSGQTFLEEVHALKGNGGTEGCPQAPNPFCCAGGHQALRRWVRGLGKGAQQERGWGWPGNLGVYGASRDVWDCRGIPRVYGGPWGIVVVWNVVGAL